MRLKSTQKLGTVLNKLIDEQGFRSKMDEVSAVEAWRQLAGDMVGAVTTNVYVRGKRLYVELSSSAWRQELHLARSAWCARLNNRLGKDVIKEIVFR